MRTAALVVGTIAIMVTAAHAKAPASPTWEQQQWRQPATAAPPHHHRKHVKHRDRGEPASSPDRAASRQITALQVEMARMRRELDDVRARTAPRPQWTADAWPPTWVQAALSRPAGATQQPASPPDLRLPSQAPATPAPPPAAQGITEAVDRARSYLIQTATVGATMARQGVELAIGRLHPDFAVRLEDAIRHAREAGLVHAGVFSAYRPPSFGVGGFKDKFKSMHAYGLAVDVTGIGGPGSAAARLWQKTVLAAGLFLPYGPNNRAEFNHTQMISAKTATATMRHTIKASAPKDVRSMWLASGVRDHVPPAEPINSARLLPNVDWSQPQ